MELWEAIKGRRSVGKMKPEAPPRESIEKILEAATWAPSHHNTEPWKFFVLTGQARDRLGEEMARIAAGKLADQDAEAARAKLAKLRANPLRAPVVIAVAVTPSAQEQVVELEEIGAVACAVQNMMLAAHELGLGTIWRTGAITYEPELKAFFGLQGREQLLGFVYVGYPDQPQREGVRKPFAEKTVWLDA
ncbi:nitroreductase family protein [Brevibacillus marinus]|uniref:nitroreductase family protein n=1 Tax=Brevibacillus marinus TaxID=2496837 RepID=UPI000F832CEF|nr:nitroreductase [Brevibacillus marinus]